MEAHRTYRKRGRRIVRLKKKRSSQPRSLLGLYLGFMGIACMATVAMVLWVVSSSSWSLRSNNSSPLLRRGANKAAATADDWDWPLVHIVNTRFMQEQGHLTTLAKARLHLFVTFCLPTMIHQSTQEFLWIIKTDPHLDVSLRNELVEYLRPHPNFFLVGSNINYQIGQQQKEEDGSTTTTTDGGGTWRNGAEGEDVLHSPIYTGDVRLLHRAHAVRDSRIVLETRLDADDGLHTSYLQYVQQTALESFAKKQQHIRWLYWCSRRHVEWFADASVPIGQLNPVQHSKLCITPGITVGFAVGTRSVPDYAHDKLYKAIEAHGGCGSSTSSTKNLDCIHLVEELFFVAVRSRTPTSAGMKDTVLDPSQKRGKKVTQQLWSVLEKFFYVSPDMARETNEYVHDHLKQIAKENLMGQCTSGHSCKLSSLEQLQKLIELDAEAKQVVTVQQTR